MIGRPEFIEMAKECADKAITLVKEEKGVLPISPEKYKRILFYSIEGKEDKFYGVISGAGAMVKKALQDEGFEVTDFVPDPGFEGFTQPVRSYNENYDLCLYVANLATKSNQTTVRINWREPMGADCPHFLTSIPTLFISVENPYHLIDVPRVRTYINTYGANAESIHALIDKLMGRSVFKGKSPVDAFCGKWDAHL